MISKIKFLFSLSFVSGLFRVAKIFFTKKQLLFFVYSKSDLQYLEKVIEQCSNIDIPLQVVFFEKVTLGLAQKSNYSYLHPYFSFFLVSKLAVTTSVGLQRKHFPFIKKIAHLPHSIVSLHMIYPEDAFLEFDYIFCSGKHHKDEVNALNKLYGSKIIALESGYTKLDLLHAPASVLPQDEEIKTILLAPSWGDGNILECMGENLIDAINNEGYRLIIRPHPMFFTDKKELIQKIESKCNNDTVILENTIDGNNSFSIADIMISDYSGVAFEFAFLRECGVLFIDVDKKILNPNYKDLNIEPIELSLRNKIGIISEINIEKVINNLEYVLNNKNLYRKKIIRAREEYLFNYLNASAIITEQIKIILNES